MPVDTSVYQNQPNPLGQLTNVFGIMNAAQQNKILQQETGLLQQRQTINQSQFQQQQSDDLRTVIGNLYNTGAKPADVTAAVLSRARQGSYNDTVTSNVISDINNAVSTGTWDKFGKQQRAQATSAAGLISQTPTYPQGGGTQQYQPTTSIPRTGVAAANPPGYEAVATGPAGAEGISNMASVANDAPNQKAMLDNLNALGNEAVSGPSSDFEKRANALALRLFGKGVTLTPRQLASSEEYGKISEQLAGQQATSAHATNAFLTNAYNTNPSLYLSKIGRQGITHMLQGNVDSIVAKNNAWNSYANGEVDGNKHSPAEFATWNRQFNAGFNPRVFQYARMTPEERSNFRSTMTQPQQQQLYKNLNQYQANGWLDMSGQ